MPAITIYLLQVANLSLQRDLLHLAFSTNAKQHRSSSSQKNWRIQWDTRADEWTVEKAQQDQNNCALNMCLALRGATDTSPMMVGESKRVCER